MGVAAVMVLSTLLLLPALAHAIPDQQSHEPGPGGCAEGWVDAFVLGMGCLYLLQEPLPWEDAGNTCKSVGGQLVEIDNEEQLAFLQQGLNFADGAHWTTAHYWWTAANDKTLEGDWVWVNSNTAVIVSSGQRVNQTTVNQTTTRISQDPALLLRTVGLSTVDVRMDVWMYGWNCMIYHVAIVMWVAITHPPRFQYSQSVRLNR